MKILVPSVVLALILSGFNVHANIHSTSNKSITGTTAQLDSVLGTSFDIALYGANEQQSQEAISTLLSHIEAMEKQLSTWRKNSSINRLNQTKTISKLPTYLYEILTLCQQWEKKTQQHFSCRLGELNKQWQQAQHAQEIPDRITLRRLAREISKQPFANLSTKTQTTIPNKVTYDIAGIAKGYILDNSVNYLRHQLPQLTGIKINIGGDIITWGSKASDTNWRIAIASHNNMAQNQQARQLSIKSGAIAHSGVGARDIVIERRHYSHILDPKEGWPLDFPHSVSVYAPDATTADATATTLSSMDISKALAWVNQQPHIEALIQTADNNSYPSQGWNKLSISTANNTHRTLTIDYQIPTFESADYERPYLAIWLTDKKNNVVRQLLLLGDSNRWAQENKRWWRNIGRKNDTMLDALAMPTRRPGDYHITWDGFNTNNQPVNENELILHMEASRENGGHDYRRQAFKLSDITTIELPEKGELGTARISSTQ